MISLFLVIIVHCAALLFHDLVNRIFGVWALQLRKAGRKKFYSMQKNPILIVYLD